MESFFILITVYVGMNTTHGFAYGSDDITRKWNTRAECEQALYEIFDESSGDRIEKAVNGNDAIIFAKSGKAFGAAHCLEINY